MTFLERIAMAWKDAAEFASRRAAALNERVHAQGTRSEAGRAQGEWVAEFERCDRQARRVQLLTLEAEDA